MSGIADTTTNGLDGSPPQAICRSGSLGRARGVGGTRGVVGGNRGWPRGLTSTSTRDNAPDGVVHRGNRGRARVNQGGGRGRGISGEHEQNPVPHVSPSTTVAGQTSSRGRGQGRGLEQTSRGRGRHSSVLPPVNAQAPVHLAALELEQPSANTNLDEDLDWDSATEVATDQAEVVFQNNENMRNGALLKFGPGEPTRPDYGVRGRTIYLRANRLTVQIIPTTLYLYHVHISPRGGSRRHVHHIYQLAEQTLAWERAGMVGTVAHDGSDKLVASHQLPQPLNINVPYHNEGASIPLRNGQVYTLSITFVQQLHTQDLIRYLGGEIVYRNHDISPILTALNLAHVTARGQTGAATYGKRHFFHALESPISLDAEIEAWRGYSLAVQSAPTQLMVKVDVGTALFHSPGNLATLLEAIQANATWLRRFRPHMTIDITHINSQKRVRGLATENANTRFIETSDFGRVTVRDYFLRKYRLPLRFPQLPLVDVGSGIYLPPEVCVVPPGQLFRGRLPNEQNSSLVQIARRSPNVNGEAILQLAQQPVGPALQSFGMDISPGLVSVPGRVLPKPNVVYSTNTAVVDDRAQWGTTRAKFIVGARLDRWAVLIIKDGSPQEYLGSDDPALRNAVKSFRETCNKSGMYITTDPTYTSVQLPPINHSDFMRRSAIEAIKVALLRVKPKPDLIMVVLANRCGAIYDGLKYLCDVILDVMTICVLSSKIRGSGFPSYARHLSSLVLKLNIKLGGINHRLTSKEGRGWLSAAPTMVMGMRVTHPGPGSSMGTPSVAAVVASVDNRFVHYPASLSIQASRLEMISDLTNMMIERLMLFKKRNNDSLPERILVYRSGLCESQFKIMREMEVPSMLSAFQKLSIAGKPYRPKLTIVACRKKHHTWFWAEENGDGNPPAGTVVDRVVTSVYDFDFYLQAHGGVDGTARPILYTAVYDENGVSADEIQEATHTLCYMYAPATQAVSVAAPIHYAVLASKRGRCYLREFSLGHFDDGDGEGSVMEAARRVWDRGGSVPGWGLSDTMFYI